MLETLTTILPSIITAILAYIIANKRAKIQSIKIITDMQVRAIESVTNAEAEMRKEIWNELEKCRNKNKESDENIEHLERKLNNNLELVSTLRTENKILKQSIESYKEEIQRKNKLISKLEEGTKNE